MNCKFSLGQDKTNLYYTSHIIDVCKYIYIYIYLWTHYTHTHCLVGKTICTSNQESAWTIFVQAEVVFPSKLWKTTDDCQGQETFRRSLSHPCASFNCSCTLLPSTPQVTTLGKAPIQRVVVSSGSGWWWQLAIIANSKSVLLEVKKMKED